MEKTIINKPWGYFEQFCKNEKVTIKIITVNPYSKISLQYHNNRDELWKIIEGEGEIVLEEKIITTKKGDEHFIPAKTKHRIITKEKKIKLIEISFGEFDENDIIRLQDEYNRI